MFQVESLLLNINIRQTIQSFKKAKLSHDFYLHRTHYVFENQNKKKKKPVEQFLLGVDTWIYQTPEFHHIKVNENRDD